MKIYTTYYENLPNLPTTITPISIAGKAPEGLRIGEYKTLAPKWSFFQEWKENRDNVYYIQHFYAEVLNKLNPKKVLHDLTILSGGKDIALVCYEKPDEFCHRHLVAHWLYCCLSIDPIQEWE